MVTRIDWGSMRGEVDRFEQYLREVKQASENTVQSYRRDLMQMITYLEEKEIREAAKVTKTSLHGYILHMEEQGKAATTISRMMAAMKAFFNYECMQACIREMVVAESGEKGAGGPECRSGISASGTAIRADTEGDSGQGDVGSFICDRNPGVRAYRDPDGRYQYEHWISGLSRRGEGTDDPIWTFGESSAGGVFGTCEKRAAAWKGIGLFLCQLYRRRDEPAGILEDYQILR